MAKKNKSNTEKRERVTWTGYFPRVTKTKREKVRSIEKKHKKDWRDM